MTPSDFSRRVQDNPQIGEQFYQAVEAIAAWFWAENNRPQTSHQACMELCNYAEYMANKALASSRGHKLVADYEGVPRIILQFPGAYLDLAEAEEVQSLVDEVLTRYRAEMAVATAPDLTSTAAHYATELALDAAARTGEDPLPGNVRRSVGMKSEAS